MKNLVFLSFICILTFSSCDTAQESPNISREKQVEVINKLIEKHGNLQRTRIESGVAQVSAVWWNKNGSDEDFEKFCLENFISDSTVLDQTFRRIENNFETINGFVHQINRELSAPIVLNLGEPLQIDNYFSKASPQIDYYRNKLAFFINLNFPRYSLETKIKMGVTWSRKQWAMVRIGDMFETRIPEDVENDPDDTALERRDYFNNYFFYMNRLLTPDQQILFPDELRLNSHHGLREEIRAQYTNPEGRLRQEMIYHVILRIIDQSVPAKVINNQNFYWEPENNLLYSKEDGMYNKISFKSEVNKRYDHFLQAVNNRKKTDSYYQQKPTVMDRTFARSQLPEERVVQILTAVLSSPEARDAARLIEKRIGRKLRPYDMWYNGFQAQGKWPEKELTQMLKKKYHQVLSYFGPRQKYINVRKNN
jgi:hypothetical protein